MAESRDADAHKAPTPPDAEVDVFWRPGCSSCSMLRRDLARRGVPATWHNIYADNQARAVVRSVNRGNETVPTVRVGSVTLTNPTWTQLAPLLGDGPWTQTRARPGRDALARLLWWVPVLAVAVLGEAVVRAGHPALSWIIAGFAVLVWAVTRRLQR